MKSLIFPRLLFDNSIAFDPVLQDLIVNSSSQPLDKHQLILLIDLVHDGRGEYESVLDDNIGLGIVINNPKLAIEILISKSTPKQSIFSGCLQTCTSIQTLDIIAEKTTRKDGKDYILDGLVPSKGKGRHLSTESGSESFLSSILEDKGSRRTLLYSAASMKCSGVSVFGLVSAFSFLNIGAKMYDAERYEDIPKIKSVLRQHLIDIFPNMGESWKQIWTAWQDINLVYSRDFVLNPILVPSTKHNNSKFTTNRLLKLGRLVFGQVTVPLQLTKCKKVKLDPQCWFNRGTKENFRFEFTDRQNNRKNYPDAKLLSFYGKPPGAVISLIRQTRSDLLILQETFPLKDNIVVRVWDPTLHKSPWLSTLPKNERVNGIWTFDDVNYLCVGLCGRKLYVMYTNEDSVTVKCLQLCDSDGSYFESFQPSIKTIWEKILELKNIQEVSISETAVCILYRREMTTNIMILSSRDGDVISDFPIIIPYQAGFESVSTNIALTRFHLIAYNSNNIVVYDLFKALLTKSPPEVLGITKVPYVGRKVRLDISDDASLVMLSPIVQLGEVVVLNLYDRTCKTYLLQNAYSGNQPKPGCWFVFEEHTKVKVEWTPIVNS